MQIHEAAYRGSRSGVLVVDDEQSVRDAVGLILERFVCAPLLYAANVREAEAILSRIEIDIHVLITDVTLPGGSGLDIAEMFLENVPDGNVVIITGLPEGYLEFTERLQRSSVLLEKPFNAEDLVQHVVRYGIALK